MRKDASKLICERPRAGAGTTRRDPARRSKDYENLPHHESTRAHHKRNHADHKVFSDFLAPLRRFLEKTVGRKWDDVYSEISRVVGKTSTTQLHVFQHIDGYVASNVVAVPLSESLTGWCAHGGFRGGWRHPINAGDLFVDPRDGIVKRAKARAKRKLRPVTPPKITLVKAPDGKTISVKLDGVWYLADLVPVFEENIVYENVDGTKWTRQQTVRRNGAGRTVPIDDPFLRHNRDIYRSSGTLIRELRNFYGAAVTAVGTKQMSREELKARGLVNDAPTRIDSVRQVGGGRPAIVTRVPV
jgi:hypothetical protein